MTRTSLLTFDDLHRGDVLGVERPVPRSTFPEAIVKHQTRIGLPVPYRLISHASLVCSKAKVVEMVPPRGRFYDLESRTISRELHSAAEPDKGDDYAGCRIHVYRYDFTGQDWLRLAIVDDAIYSANTGYNFAGVGAAVFALIRPLQPRAAEYCSQLIEDAYERHIPGGLLPDLSGDRTTPGGLCMSRRLSYVGHIEMPARAA